MCYWSGFKYLSFNVCIMIVQLTLEIHLDDFFVNEDDVKEVDYLFKHVLNEDNLAVYNTELSYIIGEIKKVSNIKIIPNEEK